MHIKKCWEGTSIFRYSIRLKKTVKKTATKYWERLPLKMLKYYVHEDWVRLDTENDWEGMPIFHNEIVEQKVLKECILIMRI